MPERGSGDAWGEFGWGESAEPGSSSVIRTADTYDGPPEEHRPYVYVRPPTLKESQKQLRKGFSPLSRLPMRKSQRRGFAGKINDSVNERGSRAARPGDVPSRGR